MSRRPYSGLGYRSCVPAAAAAVTANTVTHARGARFHHDGGREKDSGCSRAHARTPIGRTRRSPARARVFPNDRRRICSFSFYWPRAAPLSHVSTKRRDDDDDDDDKARARQ